MNRQLSIRAWELTRERPFEGLLSRQSWPVELGRPYMPAVDPRTNMRFQHSLTGGPS
jgi:hypothetical protein